MEKVINRSDAEQAYWRAEAVAKGEQPNPGDALVEYYLPRWQEHLRDRGQQVLQVGNWVAQIDRLTAKDSMAVEDIALYSDTQKVAVHLVGKIVGIEGDQLTVDVVKNEFATVERSQVIKIAVADGEAYKADYAKHHLEQQGDLIVYSMAGETLNLPRFDHNHLPSSEELVGVEKVAKSEKD